LSVPGSKGLLPHTIVCELTTRAVLSTVPNPDDDDGAQWIETVSQYVTASAEWNEEVTKSGQVLKRPSGFRIFPYDLDHLADLGGRTARGGGIARSQEVSEPLKVSGGFGQPDRAPGCGRRPSCSVPQLSNHASIALSLI